MITSAGELSYPSDADVRAAVSQIRANVAQARDRTEAEHLHFLLGGEPPLEVRS